MSAIVPTFEAPTVSDPPPTLPTDMMLAHDIRGALQGVVGGVAALEASRLPPELAAQVGRIAAASRSLESLISVAIEGRGDEAQTVSEIDLGQFVTYLRDRWIGEARSHGATLSVTRTEGTPGCLRVPHLPLARLVGNLVSNAIRHGGPGTVGIDLDPGPDNGLVVRIRDSGPGLPSETMAAFRAGFLSDNGAPGLGLHIVRDLASQLGCSVTLENRGGAVVTLGFPPSLCADNTFPREAATSPDAAEAALRGLRVLLAEDNATNQMVATQMLGALGIEVTVASDGAEALERFEEAEFDLLLVDIEMPRVSGLDVIRRVRGRGDDRAGVPLIALTAYALREHRQRIAEAGADGLISKPITSVSALARGIAAHVRHRAPSTASSDAEARPEAQVQVADDAEPVVQRAIYDALRDTIGVEMMTDLLDKFVADLEAARADLTGAVELLNRQPIRGASHILISIAGALGAVRLETCARHLNAAAQDADPGDLRSGVGTCLVEIDAAIAFARAERAAG